MANELKSSMAQFMRFEVTDREIERLRLLDETKAEAERVRLQEEDGRIHRLADEGEKLLRAAELARMGRSPESAGP